VPTGNTSTVPCAQPVWLGRRGVLVLVLLAALPFLSSLGDPFFSDDYLHIERLGVVRPETLLAALRSWILRGDDMGAWWTPRDLAVPYFRPLVTLSFLGDHAVWGMRPFGYHLTNLLLHLGTTVLCLDIARRVLRSSGSGFSAWAAAALFALHPCHTEAVSWISGRTDLLAGFFCAAAFSCYLRAQGKGDGGRRLPWLAAMLLAFLLALSAKEMALTLPLLIVAHVVLYREAGPQPLGAWARRLATPAVLLGVSAVYLGLRMALLGHAVPPHPFAHGPGDPDMLSRVLSALPLYLADLVLFIPAEPVLTYPFWMKHLGLFALLCLLCLLVLRGSLRDSSDRAASRFALIWVVVSLLPVLPVTVGERFLYLPSIGYVLLVGAKLPEVPRPAWRGLALGALILAVVGGKALQFSSMSRSSRRVIAEAVAAIDQAPQARLLLLVDLPAQSALAFAHAIRLERPDRQLQVEVVSIAPHFLSASDSFHSSVERTPQGLIVRSQGRPYLGSYIEQAFLGARPPLRTGEVVERPGYQVTVLAASGPELSAFALRFATDRPEERLILRGHGFHLAPL
jgi:hypothetical protein